MCPQNYTIIPEETQVIIDILSKVLFELGREKTVFALCEQQRRRSTCASAQSDQRLCFSLFLDSKIPLLATAEISSLLLVSVAEQASLSLTWSQTPKTGFLVTRLIYSNILFQLP